MLIRSLIKTYLGIFFLIPFSHVYALEDIDIIGNAYDLSGKKIIYKEIHRISKDGFDHRVDFIDSKDKLLAKKLINYRSGWFTPSFIQEDFTLGEVIEVNNKGDELQLRYIEEGGKNSKTVKVDKLLTAKKPLVIDAGFDNYLRSNWPQLLKGDPAAFYFPAPTRGSQVELMVERTACKAVANYKAANEEACFIISSAFWLFRLFVDPIEVRYFVDNKKLSRYRGLANIPDGKGSNYAVDIRYQYQ